MSPKEKNRGTWKKRPHREHNENKKPDPVGSEKNVANSQDVKKKDESREKEEKCAAVCWEKKRLCLAAAVASGKSENTMQKKRPDIALKKTSTDGLNAIEKNMREKKNLRVREGGGSLVLQESGGSPRREKKYHSKGKEKRRGCQKKSE